MDDTIAAISTPPGEGGIGIVRLSGEDSVRIVEGVFQSKSDKALSEFPSHTISYGHITSNGEIIDEVLVTVMRAPRTYTREDIVEINCHGGIVPLRYVLELVIHKGARLAEPGEFTRRAYLNGRIDLTQAEAVADIIRAKTDASRKVALSQLNGALGAKVEQFIQKTQDLLIQVEASIDFTAEGIVPPSCEILSREVLSLIEEIEELKSTADKGLILREGLRMSIIGRPNVGKSTLFNTLLEEDRVIVTSIPGTTRDVVEEMVDVGGIPVRMADTAGIARDSPDLIEKEGTKRSLQCLSQADLIIAVIDGSEPLTEADKHLLQDLSESRAITIINKCDLPVCVERAQVEEICGRDGILMVSAAQGTGVSELKEKIASTVWNGGAGMRGEPIVTNLRHLNALEKTSESLSRALESLGKMGEEILAFNLKKAIGNLGEIVGKVTTEDILNGIFSQFCIGK
jgi:tRNA modification GTPase